VLLSGTAHYGKPPALAAPGALFHGSPLLLLAHRVWSPLCSHCPGCKSVNRGHCWRTSLQQCELRSFLSTLLQECEPRSLLDDVVETVTPNSIIATMTLETIVAFVIPLVALLTSFCKECRRIDPNRRHYRSTDL
jgi:hypothetical protein